MNPQYMQQQRPAYGPPPSQNVPYSELNANYPPKGPQDLNSYPPQKASLGPSPTNNSVPLNNTLSFNNVPPASNISTQNSVPPLSNPMLLNNAPLQSNAPNLSNSRSPYYVNDMHGQAQPDSHHGQHTNQNNLVDQMSGMALSGVQQRPPSSQDFLPHSDKNVPAMPFPATVNGVSNQNHYPSQGEQFSQGPPTSQAPNSSSPYRGPPFSGKPEYSNQMPPSNVVPGQNIPRSTPQPTLTSSTDYSNQMPNQNRYTAPPMSNQAGMGAPPLERPPSASLPPQSASLHQTPLGPPSMSNQQNVPGPPQSRSYSSTSALPSRQGLAAPPLPGPTFQNTSQAGPKGLSRPPPPRNANSLSGPPLPGQQSLSGSYGQQNMSGPTPLQGQQNLHGQYQYNSQTTEQRRHSPSPGLPIQANAANTLGHLNHQHPEYHHGYQQQNYNQVGQSNMYANQTSLYQSPTSPTGGYSPNNQAQQARRLDPDQMPSPIQVINDDQKLKGGVFATNQKGLVPPLVTTKFTVEDQGNASPRFVRSTMYTVPTTADIIKQTQVPFSIILSPMAQVEENEYEPPIVDMGEVGPVRCNRCKAYMSPFMQFVDAGRRFQCLLCKATTEVPSEYFQHLDHTGQRMDRFERPELILGTYEFIATKDYCRNNTFPKPPAIIFVIDVSYNTVKSGLVHLLCSQMKSIIRNLPVDLGQRKSNMKVGFITYGSTVQFYNIKASLAQPQMMVVGDVHDVFMPLLDGFLVDPEESEALIDSLMSQIPTMLGDTRETEILLAPAIQAGLEALKASECTGKLMVFHSSLPIADAPGKLKNRDDRKLVGTDKEKSVIAPQTNFYNNLGQDCVGSGCSVDLFVFNNSYVDIATISQVCRLTGGEVYKYTYFQANIDGERLITDIINNISRPIAFDAVMRVRTSTGVRPTDFFGHLYMSNTTDMELASIDCDKAIAIEIKHDDKLTEDEGVYIQAALLYTSCSGVRRLRIINLSLKTSSQMAELYRACDLDAIINFFFKQSVFKLIDSSSKAVKDNLNTRCATILASYRKHCASPTSAGQLILPECMKLLPLYINGLQKSDAISGGSGITLDQKSYVMTLVATMPINESLVHIYPRLLPLHDIDVQDLDLPPMMRCSIDRFTDDGAYLLENGIHMFLWLGSNLSPQWVHSVFGVSSVGQVDTDKTTIPVLDNSLNKRIRDIIKYVQSERRYCMRLTLTRQQDKIEMVMRQFLIEDRGADGSPGYVDFLCHMHREIRSLLS